MMNCNCFEFDQYDHLLEGIALWEGQIRLGSEGRGRERVLIPVPVGATVKDERLVSLPLKDTMIAVLVRDQSGFRGSWELTAPRTEAEWDGLEKRRRIHRDSTVLDLPEGHEFEWPCRPFTCPACNEAFGPVPERRPVPKGVIRATGYCAQGAAGRMGGGPEHLIVLRPGQAVEACRSGRLYGAPAVLRLENVGGRCVVTAPRKEAAARIDAAALEEVLA